MPVLPKKVCNVSYHAPKEGENGATRGQKWARASEEHRKGTEEAQEVSGLVDVCAGLADVCTGLVLGLHWSCLGSHWLADVFADVFAAALHKRRVGGWGGRGQRKSKARQGLNGKAQPRHAMYIHTHTRTYIHIHYIIVFCSRMPLALAGVRWPVSYGLGLGIPLANFFCLLCIFVVDIPQTMPYNGAIK